MMSTNQNSDIDNAILAVVREQWRKVAFIIATVVHARNDQAVEDDYNLVAARIVALVEQGRLESQGDLSNLRYSEVRLVGPKR